MNPYASPRESSDEVVHGSQPFSRWRHPIAIERFVLAWLGELVGVYLGFTFFEQRIIVEREGAGHIGLALLGGFHLTVGAALLFLTILGVAARARYKHGRWEVLLGLPTAVSAAAALVGPTILLLTSTGSQRGPLLDWIGLFLVWFAPYLAASLAFDLSPAIIGLVNGVVDGYANAGKHG